ncbi:hypothetical protein E2C01_029412 [Portunus trituberculatus]|uniref:Uncharacterized protein n=1 Tax=Portunus trituberculatus TaxID=210409 RepID=A0A5B7EP64_PORTR|nr:hypothetical protein [Portunus trituberculatus]
MQCDNYPLPDNFKRGVSIFEIFMAANQLLQHIKKEEKTSIVQPVTDLPHSPQSRPCNTDNTQG